MASTEALAMKDAFAAWAGSLAGKSMDDMRASFHGLSDVGSIPDGVTFTDVDAGGVPAIWAVPDDASATRGVVYLHGGGFMLGAPEFYKALTGHLAKELGCRVLNVDYRLAPEHQFPAALDDSVAAYRWMLTQGVEAAGSAIVGDSAGGGLTLSSLMQLRDDGGPLPAAAIAISPLADLEATGDSMTTNAANDVLIQQASTLGMGMMYAGEDVTNPLASPLLGDYAGLPPIAFVVGSEETLLDDSTRCAAAAEAAGVDTTLDVVAEMQHDFVLGVGNVPESDAALQRMVSFLDAKLAG